MVIHWLIFPYPSGLLHWHCGNLTIAPVPAKQPWWIWINTSCKTVHTKPQQNTATHTVYPKKYAHGFVVLCFVVVIQSFIMNSHEVFIHIHQGCFAGTGAIVRLPQCQWSKPDGDGKISQCITTTKHSKAKTVCIFLGIYCMCCTYLDWHTLAVCVNTDLYLTYEWLCYTFIIPSVYDTHVFIRSWLYIEQCYIRCGTSQKVCARFTLFAFWCDWCWPIYPYPSVLLRWHWG